MDGATLSNYMVFADKVVNEAAELMKEGFYGEKIIETKGGRSWDLVTDYDKNVEKIIITNINQSYPTHKVLAEEESAEKGKKDDLTDDPTWIIDPIDGTFNYARGLPLTCISVGLAIEKRVVVGIVYNPLSGDKYTAVRGQGAFLNGRPIHVSSITELSKSAVSFELPLIRIPGLGEKLQRRYLAIVHKVNGVRLLGTAALTLCMVASGALDVYMHEFLQSWDMAAGVLIIEEAGGVITNINGDEFDLTGRNIIAAANKELADEFVKIVKENS